jgi:DNA repair exonuclease SbcCD ATPase subunit
VCPTCLRPLSDHERNNALEAHGSAATTATNEVSRLREEANRLRAQLTRVADISRALAKVRPPSVPAFPDPGLEAIARVDAATNEANELAVAAGAAQERATAADRQLATLRSAAEDQERLKDLARQEALLGLTRDSLVRLADRYLKERVEPLAREIGHRWKVMFGHDGLRFASDGELTVERADVNLELDDLSGGERATALLVTRLMLSASVTEATTLWLDEPLEHLDPRRRVGVAQALVQAVQVGTVRQILITTYEETIARRLVATSPDLVAMTNARTADDQLV